MSKLFAVFAKTLGSDDDVKLLTIADLLEQVTEDQAQAVTSAIAELNGNLRLGDEISSVEVSGLELVPVPLSELYDHVVELMETDDVEITETLGGEDGEEAIAG